MKRILINATHNEEIRVALCRGSYLYDFDLENRTREQKKANIYKGYVTRIEPSLEAVFVEYGSNRQGFLPLREIAPEYLTGNPNEENIKKLIKEGDELIVQIKKEERGNKGAAISTYISLAGRYLVLMPNIAKGGGISRQISGKTRDDMRSILADLTIPKGMSIIVRTAGIGKTFDDLQNDLSHLLDIWNTVTEISYHHRSPKLLYQEAGVVTRAMRDYLRDDISEVWIDSEHAYNEAAGFIESVMPSQLTKLRKYTDYEPLFVRFGVERQIETAYQREVNLPSGGSIVIDQTEALVSIDINSAKSTKGSDVSETAYHTNLEATEEIARQLRLRDIGGLIVIDFIDMNDPMHQKEVEKRLIDSTRHDRARVQFAEISKFGLMEMSRQRLRPSLEESTGYLCPRCHGNGMIRDLRSLALSIMRQIEQLALKQRTGEIQAEVPIEIAAFLLNEKRESLVYLEQDSGARITILPHTHLESPNFELHFNVDGFAPASYNRIVDTEELQNVERGYEINWQTNPIESAKPKSGTNHWQSTDANSSTAIGQSKSTIQTQESTPNAEQPKALAWLSNLFAPKPESCLAESVSTQEVALAIETIVNTGAVSLGTIGTINKPAPEAARTPSKRTAQKERSDNRPQHAKTTTKTNKSSDKTRSQNKPQDKRQERTQSQDSKYPKREAGSRREPREPIQRSTPIALSNKPAKADNQPAQKSTDRKTYPADALTMPDASKQTETATGDIVICIEKLDHALPKPMVIHLSLDNSKPADPTQTTPNEATKNKAIENKVMANKATENKAVEKKATKQPHAHKTTRPSQDLSVMATQPTMTPAKAKYTAIENKLATLAAVRGLAKNDPRIVTEVLHPNNAGNTQKIAGKAGDFIRKMLSNAEACLAEDGFITCFNKAVALARANNDCVAKMDFANYGYPPLSKDYLASFKQQTCASGAFSTAQGKTAVIDRPKTPRAKNDPRQSDANANTAGGQTVGGQTADIDEATDNSANPDPAINKDDNPLARTTPAKYKNMIESVAEQLLPPPTGILKLASPKKAAKVAIKIPKVDTKPKFEIKRRQPKTATTDHSDTATLETKTRADDDINTDTDAIKSDVNTDTKADVKSDAKKSKRTRHKMQDIASSNTKTKGDDQ